MEMLSYLLNFLAILFVGFRAWVAIKTGGMDYTPFEVININMEIAITFISLVSIVMIMRRSIFFASIYLGSYIAYFGYGLSVKLTAGVMDINTFVYILGLMIALLNFMDVLLNFNRKGRSKGRATEWFYGNTKYERELDERADKNQYKIR